jgi:hypothetical protein
MRPGGVIAGEVGLVLQLKWKRRGTFLGVVGAITLPLASSAHAANVTVGQLSAPNTFPCIGTVTYLQTGVDCDDPGSPEPAVSHRQVHVYPAAGWRLCPQRVVQARVLRG